jgi:hypothetical protein
VCQRGARGRGEVKLVFCEDEKPTPLKPVSYPHFPIGFDETAREAKCLVDRFTNTSIVIGFSSLPKKMWVKIRPLKPRSPEKSPLFGEGGETKKTRSSYKQRNYRMLGGRPQWIHLVYSGPTGMSK